MSWAILNEPPPARRTGPNEPRARSNDRVWLESVDATVQPPLRILQVEDDPRDAELVVEMLTAEGIQVDSVRVDTREDYIAALDRGGFDLILSDNTLPALDGMTALVLARERRPDIPYIVVSGTIGEEVAVETLKNGATDYVLKDRLTRLVPVTRRALSEAAERRERVQAEAALRQNEERFRALVENAYDITAIVRADGTVEYISPSVERILGHPAAAALSWRLFDFVHPDDAPAAAGSLKQAIRNRDTPTSIPEIRVQHADGSWRTLEGKAHNLLDNPAVAGIVVNLHDITERKRAESETQLKIQHLAALRQIDVAISSSLDLRVTLSILLDQVTAQLRVDAAAVLLLNRGSMMLEFAAGRGFRTARFVESSLAAADLLRAQPAFARGILAFCDVRIADSVPESARSAFDGLASTARAEGFVALFAVALVDKGQLKGMLEIIHRAALAPDQAWFELLEAMAGQAAIAVDSAQSFDGLQRANAELTLAYDTTIEGWSRALDLRDKETEGHTQRVTEVALRLARALGFDETALVQVRRGGLLHDIGKMGVPDSILLKPGALDEAEWQVMRQHPTNALRLLSPIAYLRPALDIPYCHHERWDGKGYPRGLQGKEIPLAARLFSVVDVWDALLSDRPYRRAWTSADSREYIRTGSGTLFDPAVVDPFLNMITDD